MSLITTEIPKEITEDCDTHENIASFDYYSGIKFAKENNLQQGTNMRGVSEGTHFIVCCGDVMVKVKPMNYPEIIRRIF